MTTRQGWPEHGSHASGAAGLRSDGNFLVASDVRAWVEKTASAVSQCVGDRNVIMHLRAYRHQGLPHLACDLCPADDDEKLYPITFITGGHRELDQRDPCATDLVEALFLAGLLAERLGARAVIDGELG